MDITFIVLVIGIAGAVMIGGMALMEPSAGKASGRRLANIRMRHSESQTSQVEKQMRKAIAQRKPSSGAQKSGMLEQFELRLTRTGRNIPLKKIGLIALAVGGGIAVVGMALGMNPFLSLFVGFLLGAGGPWLWTGRLINKRRAAFIKGFPDAIDLLVRGLRSGLPVSETLGVVAKELDGPISEEFRKVTESMRIGRTMDDALTVSAKRLLIAEFDFFCITLAIQRETGGNLAETLNNLSVVLRSRAAMALKVKALTSEGKASAYIVGALPFCVFAMIFTINQPYLIVFFQEERMMMIGVGALGWMGIGVLIMAKMINFEI